MSPLLSTFWPYILSADLFRPVLKSLPHAFVVNGRTRIYQMAITNWALGSICFGQQPYKLIWAKVVFVRKCINLWTGYLSRAEFFSLVTLEHLHYQQGTNFIFYIYVETPRVPLPPIRQFLPPIQPQGLPPFWPPLKSPLSLLPPGPSLPHHFYPTTVITTLTLMAFTIRTITAIAITTPAITHHHSHHRPRRSGYHHKQYCMMEATECRAVPLYGNLWSKSCRPIFTDLSLLKKDDCIHKIYFWSTLI